MDAIASAIGRLERAVERRSGFGVATNVSVTTSSGGLQCATHEGDFCTRSDLSPAFGGDATAPSPGALLRAALGSCMAMSYRLRAAKHGVELRSIRVTVEADSELAGMLSLDSSAPPGYSEIRFHVEVESPAAPDEVMSILDEGDRLSPLLDAISRANVTRRTTSIRAGG